MSENQPEISETELEQVAGGCEPDAGPAMILSLAKKLMSENQEPFFRGFTDEQ